MGGKTSGRQPTRREVSGLPGCPVVRGPLSGPPLKITSPDAAHGPYSRPWLPQKVLETAWPECAAEVREHGQPVFCGVRPVLHQAETGALRHGTVFEHRHPAAGLATQGGLFSPGGRLSTQGPGRVRRLPRPA